jgi:hypothetical protein
MEVLLGLRGLSLLGSGMGRLGDHQTEHLRVAAASLLEPVGEGEGEEDGCIVAGVSGGLE